MRNPEVKEFLDNLGGGSGEYQPPPSRESGEERNSPVHPPPVDVHQELVVEKNGEVRQAGATDLNGRVVNLLRKEAEIDLYFFARIILKLDRIVPHLHGEVCKFAMKSPPYRKLILIPRDHFKTTIFSKALPLHKFIQPKANNIYWPGHIGLEHKILLACETQNRSEKHVQWIQEHLAGNPLIKGFWPHICWDNPSRDARAWNKQQFFLPRELSYEQSDPTMMGIGVGGTITGAHVTDIIDDDLVSFEASRSPAVMEEAIAWHIVSRALLEDLSTSREYIVGTKWAVNDLYGYIEKNDPTVTIYKRSIVEDGKIIFPEEFTWEDIKQLEESMGEMFPLLYMNNAKDARLVDFNEDDIRFYTEHGDTLAFDEDPRDEERFKLVSGHIPDEGKKGADRFRTLDWKTLRDELGPRDSYLLSKHGGE